MRAVNRRQWKTFRKLLHAVSMAVAAPSANDIHRSVWSRALCMPRLSPKTVNVLELDHKSNGASADFHRAAPALSKGGRVARPAMQLCGNHSRWPICGPAVRTSHGRKVHQRSAFVKRHSPQSALSLASHASTDSFFFLSAALMSPMDFIAKVQACDLSFMDELTSRAISPASMYVLT